MHEIFINKSLRVASILFLQSLRLKVTAVAITIMQPCKKVS